MAPPRTDGRQLDLLDWAPPEVAPAFEPERVRAASLRGRVSRAVGAALKDSELQRFEIASRMSDFLGEPVSADMLNAYASQAREDNTISAVRLVGLVHATGDNRLLQALLEQLDLVAIPRRYIAAIEEAMVSRKIEELNQRLARARKSWGPGK